MKTMAALLTAALVAPGAAIPAPGGQDKPPIQQKDLLQAQAKLKQIGFAVINYSDLHQGRMPTNIRDKAGKDLLSWRVAILPFIEEDGLYKQFKLDEPWDSENNRKLIGRMPRIYAPMRVKAREGETYYQTFSGAKALFGPNLAPLYPRTITDGTANTGLIFEAGEPVTWTKPADLPFDEKKSLPKLGGLFDGECNVVLCDGSVKRLKKNADGKEMKLLIMPNDGMVINLEKLEK